MERALALARWPASDRERARFHERYIVPVSGVRIEYVTLEQVEVITEFRRLELIAEAHAGLNDSFGRAGTREVDEAFAPWRGRLSIVAHLRFDVANRVISGPPDVTVVLDGARDMMPTTILPRTIGGGHGAPTGETVEAVFDATAVGQATRTVLVRWQGRELGRVIVDFARLE